MFRSRGRRRFGGGKRFKRSFTKKRSTPLTKQPSYKFAAPAAKAKVTVYGFAGNMNAINDSGQEPFNLANWNADPELMKKRMEFAICANDCKDPFGNRGNFGAGGKYAWVNNGPAGATRTSVVWDSVSRPVGWSNWMKLYRKCYVTGCRLTVYTNLGGRIGEAAGNTYPAAYHGPILMAIAPSEVFDDGTTSNRYAEIWGEDYFTATGNPQAATKVIWPKTSTTQADISAINGVISKFASVKKIFGLKSILNDELLSCNSTRSTDATKTGTMNFICGPMMKSSDTQNLMMACGNVCFKVTYWCVFASRRTIAAADNVDVAAAY